jgi:uncharacterized integral membrane protein
LRFEYPAIGYQAMILFILIILIVAVATVFSVQNAVPVTLAFFAWRFSASLAVLIFLSILTGMLIASLFSLSMRLRKSLRVKGKRPKGTEGLSGMGVDHSNPVGNKPV